MKITPPSGCICAVYYDSSLIFTMKENWDAKATMDQAICDNTQFDEVDMEDLDFDDSMNRATFRFTSEYGDGFVELEWITLY